MSSYKVFKHPEEGFEAVKSGFAWLAPFNPVWPLFRGLWMLFITYIFVILVLASVDALIYGPDDFIDISKFCESIIAKNDDLQVRLIDTLITRGITLDIIYETFINDSFEIASSFVQKS